MCIRFPNWDQGVIELGDSGFLTFNHIQFSPLDFWEQHGYEVVPFGLLANVCDFGEISHDQDLVCSILNEIGVL